jgi:maltose alpha-D-glucosyltransferase/alpha-amylase
MQWGTGKNLGFSDADAGALYLPVDPAADAPTVQEQEADPDSLLNTVRALLKLRHAEADLQADGDLEVLCAEKGKPLVYRRGALTLAVNPSGDKLFAELKGDVSEALYMLGMADVNGGRLVMGPQSFVVLK